MMKNDNNLLPNCLEDIICYDTPTIGPLLCRMENRVTVDWSLKSTNVPIGVSTYELKNQLPEDLLDKLQIEEKINSYLDIEEDKDGK